MSLSPGPKSEPGRLGKSASLLCVILRGRRVGPIPHKNIMDNDQQDSCEFEEALYRLHEVWKPVNVFGWTWLTTSTGAPESYSLFDRGGELMGHVYQRFKRTICWAPFTWAEEAYRSEEDVGEYGYDSEGQRRRHFEKIGQALREWVTHKQRSGVDLVLLRDTHAYYFETGNGHHVETLAEREYREARRRLTTEREEEQALSIDGWTAVPNTQWYCEGYRLRDGAGQLRGQVQVRYGVVRAVAAGKKDADEVDPLLQGAAAYKRTCRGQIVFQEKTRPMAVEFTQAERDYCIRHAIEAIRATPKPDRTWPPETLGAKGTAEQQMFPTTPRDWT